MITCDTGVKRKGKEVPNLGTAEHSEQVKYRVYSSREEAILPPKNSLTILEKADYATKGLSLYPKKV